MLLFLFPAISHLFFADDSLIFAKALRDECLVIRHCLEVYARASGQVINFRKSAISVSRSVPTDAGHELARIVGVNFVSCHEKYLGLMWFTSRNKKQVFASIKDRIWLKLQGWQSRLFRLGVKRYDASVATHNVLWWKALWKLGIPPKIRTFIWKCCHHWIPTKLNLSVGEFQFQGLSISQSFVKIGFRWCKPDVGIYKINTNAAINGLDQKVGLGFLIRNSSPQCCKSRRPGPISRSAVYCCRDSKSVGVLDIFSQSRSKSDLVGSNRIKSPPKRHGGQRLNKSTLTVCRIGLVSSLFFAKSSPLFLSPSSVVIVAAVSVALIIVVVALLSRRSNCSSLSSDLITDSLCDL
ncbi:hypothetical protein Ddye_008184 [Dipteronia dyeriana]|uniref:Reverse transcriptase domain-containing protein n=1 Tax=Dipteronia dyeriana TaxID=168575 RepID=A0AAD9X9C4_9ROSI|nr:hypothetical protein Ddye_008184 [Dipteronia dyeriana]